MTLTPQDNPLNKQNPDPTTVLQVVRSFGEQLRGMLESVSSSFTAVNRVVTNAAQAVERLRHSQLKADRALWKKQQETLRAVQLGTDEQCRARAEDQKINDQCHQEVMQELQNMRRLLVCAFHEEDN